MSRIAKQFFTLPLIVISLLSCAEVVFAEKVREQASADTVQIIVRPSANEYQKSGDVQLSFSAKNLTDHDLGISGSPPPSSFQLIIRDSTGAVIDHNAAQTIDGAPVQAVVLGGPLQSSPALAARSTFTFANRGGTKTTFPLSAWGYSLPAGTYTVSAILGYSESNPISESVTIKIDN